MAILMMIPGMPLVTLPIMNTIGPGRLAVKKVARTQTAIPATILPVIMLPISDMYTFTCPKKFVKRTDRDFKDRHGKFETHRYNKVDGCIRSTV